MKPTPSASRFLRRIVGIGIVSLLCGQALSVAAQDRSEKLRRFEADRQACVSGSSGQVFESCMKEAKAVLAERPGDNPTVSADQLQRNASIRCAALTGEDHAACVARMRGEGTVSGSVAGGGVLRELVTTEVVASPPQKPASASSSK